MEEEEDGIESGEDEEEKVTVLRNESNFKNPHRFRLLNIDNSSKRDVSPTDRSAKHRSKEISSKQKGILEKQKTEVISIPESMHHSAPVTPRKSPKDLSTPKAV